MADSGSRSRHVSGADLRWLDLLKAVAICWIFLNHLSEQLFGGPYFGNPYDGWPPLVERFRQLKPLIGLDFWTIPANLLRYVGWCGDQGVQLFIIASGFGLTWGLLERGDVNSLLLGEFWWRRGRRVFPPWWSAHVVFFFLWLTTGIGLSLLNVNSYLSFLGIRFTPQTFYYFAPAWWFIGLLLQFYLVYPVLWRFLGTKGPLWLLVVGSAASLAVRALGLLILSDGLDFWSRGGVFVTRLPEFLFGMSLAAWYHENPRGVSRVLKQTKSTVAGFLLYVLGMCSSFFLLGMTVAPVLLGIGAFLVLYPLLAKSESTKNGGLGVWLGNHSYSLFLMHHPFILFLLRDGTSGPAEILRSTFWVAVLTVVAALLIEYLSGLGSELFNLLHCRRWFVRVGVAMPVLGVLAGIALISAEIWVRGNDPQEVYGWGERPSLAPHERFGWYLKPSTRTRLRWESYDYTLESNSLGFPGKEYPAERSAETNRILTIGDAFTSAEGVDTETAWPRLLEEGLNDRLHKPQTEVLNLAVTGYGPEQYSAVLEHHAPLFEPDLIVIGFFVNEYQDVLISNEEFRRSIGFGRPVAGDSCSILTLPHLSRFVWLRLLGPLHGAIRNRPHDHGYFLGGFAALETEPSWDRDRGRELVREHLNNIARLANKIDTDVLVLLVPAPVQVCAAEHLRYFPRGLDLEDPSRFDFDRPQRETIEIAQSLGFEVVDLRPTLSLEGTGGECVYQARNMHWTEEGHRRVASHVAEYLTDRGF